MRVGACSDGDRDTTRQETPQVQYTIGGGADNGDVEMLLKVQNGWIVQVSAFQLFRAPSSIFYLPLEVFILAAVKYISPRYPIILSPMT